MYSIHAYYLAKQFLELPPSILVPTVYLLLCYWTVGFSTENNPEEFFQILLVGILLINVAIGYGYFISASCKHFQTATNVAPLMLM
jgi:hypothetical protein